MGFRHLRRENRGCWCCLSGGERAVLIRRLRKIRGAGFDFDDTVSGVGTGDQFLITVGKQQKTDAKENDHGRYCDKPERDKVKQDDDIGLQRVGALIRGIGALIRYLGGLGSGGLGRISPRKLSRQRIEQPCERSVGHFTIAPYHYSSAG
jgi:hypothetical protein